MKRIVATEKGDIGYTVLKRKNSRHIRLAVKAGGEVSASAPWFVPLGMVDRFISSRADWILEKIEKQKRVSGLRPGGSKKEYELYKEKARELAHSRLAFFNTHYNLKYTKVRIGNQKSRWGSCSARGVLSFTYKIALLDPRFADYIIVHELCHLGQFNHSQKFWDLVAEKVPDYKIIRKDLKGALK